MRVIRPTIYDIARAANVSKSTVSRVLNNSSNISEESKRRVNKAIKELNFQPNKMARGLTSGFDAILVISRPTNTTIGNPFFSEIIQTITSIAEEENFDIILQPSKSTNDSLEKCISKINEKMIKGIILLSSPIDDSFFSELDKYDIPIAVVGKLNYSYRNIFSVDTDNFTNSYKVVQHLIDNGHREIACIHQPLKYNAAIDRVSGYKQCLIDNDIPICDDWIVDCGYSNEDTIFGITKLLNSKKLPSAIFTPDELKVLCIYGTASKLNLSIPNDLSVVGLANGIMPKLLSPPTTGITLPVSELGEIATRMLLARIKNIPTSENEIIVAAGEICGESVLNKNL